MSVPARRPPRRARDGFTLAFVLNVKIVRCAVDLDGQLFYLARLFERLALRLKQLRGAALALDHQGQCCISADGPQHLLIVFELHEQNRDKEVHYHEIAEDDEHDKIERCSATRL